jgi:asparagine synthase (glutamine-hydrolysing)
MAMQIGLHRNRGFRWHARDSVYAKGYLHDSENRYIGAERLPEYFSGVTTQAALEEKLQAANGCFAVVIQRDGLTMAAVDRVRSIPLFYGRGEDGLVVSDDAFWLADQLGGLELDPVSESEFLLSGYVLGNGTLCRSVKQLQAGQYLVAGGAREETSFYYKHLHDRFIDQDESQHFSDLDTVYRRVFERLAASAGGRTIAVLLSGGYDSRLVAAMLKNVGCKDVVCFTYGMADCAEGTTAARVAEALGYPWHFVEYSEEKWQAYFSTAEYAVFASNLASLPQIEFFPAVSELSRSAVIPPDAIIVPGFCGDLQGGSYVPDAVVANTPQRLLKMGLTEYIYRTHLRLKNEIPRTHVDTIKARIAECLSRFPEGTDVETFISANEAFFTNHKVAKYVINGLRTFDFFGHEWRLPLWDNEFMAHWYRIPYTERTGDKLYNRHLMTNIFEPLGIAFHKKQRPVEEKARLLARRLFSSHTMAVLLKMYTAVNPWRRDLTHLNAFPSLMRILEQDLQRRGHGIHSVTSVTQCYASWYLKAVQDLYGESAAGRELPPAESP